MLHLICGLPGSGKTTLGKRLEQAGLGLFCPDPKNFSPSGEVPCD